MPTDLRWFVSVPASCLHATSALFEGREFVEPATADALSEPAAALATWLQNEDLPTQLLSDHLAPLAVTLADPRQQAEVALTKVVGRNRAATLVTSLARHLQQLQSAFARSRPNALQELELRAGPLREQWEARGPGLMAALGRFTEPGLIVSTADVIVVHPVLGGGGAAHVLYNSVRIEGLLANFNASLPEILRLAWLAAQLNQDLPDFQGQLLRDRAMRVAAMALVPAILAAAEDIDLIRGSGDNLAETVQAWNLDVPEPTVLSNWWAAYGAAPTAWHIALAGLDRMLG